ncbi:hypothetical protein ACFQY3_23735 [Paenibacillus farraposensis]|uniref:hypothetical protein n=1 Tax=Paenibacillus farraposensis TaxID=2807095 RepID=UPI003610BE5A
MAGTKMILRRYGNEIIYWDEQEIIVDQAYLDKYKDLYIRLTHPYILGTRMLDVYLNGQHLLAQGGYEEVDENTIRLDLGIYPQEHPLAGQHIPLVIGDEIYIRTWKPEYRRGAEAVLMISGSKGWRKRSSRPVNIRSVMFSFTSWMTGWIIFRSGQRPKRWYLCWNGFR